MLFQAFFSKWRRWQKNRALFSSEKLEGSIPEAAKGVEELNEDGKYLFLSGDPEGALACFDAALSLRPDYYPACSNRGAALKSLKRLDEALESFGFALEINPDDANAYYNKGLTLLDLGRPLEALVSLDAALAIRPAFAEAHSSRGIALKELGRDEEGLACFEAALTIKPDCIEAHCNRGLLLCELKRPEEALASYCAALAIDANCCEAYAARGRLLLDLERQEEALTNFEAALVIDPDSTELHGYRGLALQQLSRPEEALASFDAALSIEPDCADAHFNRGVVLQNMERLEEALKSFSMTLLFAPNHGLAHFHRGVIFLGLKRFDEALTSFAEVLPIKSDWAEVHLNRGVALNGLMRNDEALASIDMALSIKPDFAEAHNCRGVVLNGLERQEEALASYGKALTIDPQHAVAYNNRGVVGSDLKGPEYALENFEAALAVEPDYIDAIFNKSLILLIKGMYQEGWSLYEWRWRRENVKQMFGFKDPSWLGEGDILGKTILIYPEQGFGDYIQFCRYALTLRSMGANVVLEVPKALVSVISTLGEGFTLVEKGRELPSFEYQCPVMSLPLALRTKVESIPACIPYLFADQKCVAKWRDKLGSKQKPRIGLVWSGSPTHKKDYSRSIPLELFAQVLDLPLEFHCLQKEIRSSDEDIFSRIGHIQSHLDEINDFSDTAGLIETMDLIISVDTSIAHLAGALGKPVWILLPCAPDFRWMLNRTDSPWYPTATLFRQSRIGDWGGVLLEVKRRLDFKFFAA